jgi:DNA helicase HerA-like ATPase
VIYHRGFLFPINPGSSFRILLHFLLAVALSRKVPRFVVLFNVSGFYHILYYPVNISRVQLAVIAEAVKIIDLAYAEQLIGIEHIPVIWVNHALFKYPSLITICLRNDDSDICSFSLLKYSIR